MGVVTGVSYFDNVGTGQVDMDVNHVARPLPAVAGRGRVLVVEDEEIIRDAVGPLLEEEGYEVIFAENGREALGRLNLEPRIDLIVLDLRMPVMDGWTFRAIQKNDKKLRQIPVLAMSADNSSQAAAISADGYLRKPVAPADFLATIERLLFENEARSVARLTETERLASLGRLAAAVGHEINNPLAFVMLNLSHSIENLGPSIRSLGQTNGPTLPELDLDEIRDSLVSVAGMLGDCQIGGERIRQTVSKLQRLARPTEGGKSQLDVHQLIEESVSQVWDHICRRARLVKSFGRIPPIRGNGVALKQVFQSVLVDVAEALPESQGEPSEILVSTMLDDGENGVELVVEISESGQSNAPELGPEVFEPLFTPGPPGPANGLGYFFSRQTVLDHGGRMTARSELNRGTVFRIVLPIDGSAGPSPARHELETEPDNEPEPENLPEPADVPEPNAANGRRVVPSRGRVLVIDDEPLIGRVIKNALKREHDVSVFQSASAALSLLDEGETFDLVLCDVTMPELDGPGFYARVAKRWPQLLSRMVFMTGGAFTPTAAAFMRRGLTPVLAKPFQIEVLRQLVSERVR
jgi:CheY-like chemotaxis protein